MKHEKTPPQPVTVEPKLWEETLKWEDEPVLILSLRRPSIPGGTAPLRRMDRYYARLEEAWRTHWTGPLYQRACVALAAARENSRPFRPWEAGGDYAVTYNRDGLLSLRLESWERGGGSRPLSVLRGDVWDAAAGVPVPLRALFPPRANVKRLLLNKAAEQIEARTASGEYLYYADWSKRLKADFSYDRFYLTEGGEIAFFYPLYTLAPYAEGRPVFSVPAGVSPPAPENSENSFNPD